MKYLFSLLISLLFVTHAFAKQHATLRIAVDLEPPIIDLIDNEFVGEDIDIIKALASAMKLTPEFILCPFARCLSILRQGQADLMIGLRRTVDREQHFTFIDSYLPLKFIHSCLPSLKCKKNPK